MVSCLFTLMEWAIEKVMLLEEYVQEQPNS